MRWSVWLSAAASIGLGAMLLGSGQQPPVLEVSNLSVLPNGATGPGGIPTEFDTGSTYWIPFDAPVEQMPTENATASACGAPLTQWLKRYGISLAPQRILMWNISGVAQDIRVDVDGTESLASVPGMLVQCGFPRDEQRTPIPGAVAFEPAPIQLTGEAAGAYVDPELVEVFRRTLEPGEQIGISAYVQGRTRFEGRALVHTTSAGGRSRSVESIPVLLSQGRASSRIDWPGMNGNELVRMVFDDSDGIWCQRASISNRGHQCGLDEVRALGAAYRRTADTTTAPSRLPLPMPVSPSSSRLFPGFPIELQGTWCTRSGVGECFSLGDVFEHYPGAFLLDQYVSEAPDATTFHVCLEEDLDSSCSTAASLLLRYFPPGAAWDCVRTEVEGHGWPGCSPDYTEAHVVSDPRLVVLPSHQHDTQYDDAEPLYREASGWQLDLSSARR